MTPGFSTRQMDPDEVLFARTRRGDGVAFAALVTRYWNAVHRIGWNMLPGKAAAAEVAEATFLAVLQGASFSDGAPFRTALYRKAMSEASKRTVAEAQGATKSLGIFLPRFDTHGRLTTSGTDWTRLPGWAFDQDELAETIRAILLRLDALDRAAFVLGVVEQLPLEEAAAALRIAAHDARHRTHRASLVVTGFLAQLFESARTSRLC
jgi:DNA-directed RNA polymerase specialized sigma24 family protein